MKDNLILSALYQLISVHVEHPDWLSRERVAEMKEIQAALRTEIAHQTFTYGQIVSRKTEADWLLESLSVNEARLNRPLTTEERAETLRLIRKGDTP